MSLSLDTVLELHVLISSLHPVQFLKVKFPLKTPPVSNWLKMSFMKHWKSFSISIRQSIFHYRNICSFLLKFLAGSAWKPP